MTNKPNYWLAWQAFSQVSSLMYSDLKLVSRQYANNALQFLFSNQALVIQGVLASFNSTEQTIIYTDTKFGMNTIDGLLWWVLAAQNGNSSLEYQSLVEYYVIQAKINMTDNLMN